MNPKKVQQLMKKMGMEQKDISATEVIIKTVDSEIVITNPNVSKVNMMGQETFQITGSIHTRPRSSEKIEIDEEDIKTVAEQADVSLDEAKKAIEKANGDLAEAILNLTT